MKRIREQRTEPQKDDAERRRVEETLRRFFADKDDGVAAVYLFGSVARNRDRDGSDVDVGVLFSQDPPRTLSGLHLGWASELSRELGRPVDLVVLNFADADLVHNMQLESRLVVERDAESRVDFEVRARREYFDLLPILRRYRHPERVT